MQQTDALKNVKDLQDFREPFLLHACCGPCLEWPARQYLLEGRSFTAWFYNPNIHPPVEHERRRIAFLDLAARLGIQALAESVSEPDAWTSWHGAKVDRCRMCYRLRLDAAARKAAELGLTAFTTTLLISPWQDHEALIEAGSLAASRHQVLFLYQDMRPFYREGQKSAREDGLYRQRYCGCLPSIEDSFYRDKIRRDLANLEAKAGQSSGSSAGDT